MTFAPKDIVYNPGGRSYEYENGGFNDATLPGVLWGVDVSSDMGIDLHSWWGQTDMFTYSYATGGEPKVISDRLFNAIRDDDVRKGQFSVLLQDLSFPTKERLLTITGICKQFFGPHYHLLPHQQVLS